MADKIKSTTRSRFLSRLLRDEAGNTIAILAAAVLPVIGLTGGAVDMGRLYLVQSRLQSACDAGVLMGRRVMGTSTWDSNGNLPNTRALQMFDTNFAVGTYGTGTRTRSFAEESTGTIRGTATAEVPMTLMRVFNQDTRTISVSCMAQFSPPTTDVMFVLDTTGSMNCPTTDSSCGNNGNVEASDAKMRGLRRATKCFYEFLTKDDIDDVSNNDCAETSAPSGGNTDVRIRFGFVPYSVNVNVGRLLPLNYLANNWTYQSREPRYSGTATAWYPDYGDPGPFTQTGSSTASQSDSGWTNMSTDLTTGGFWPRRISNVYSADDCDITTMPTIPNSIAGTRTPVSQVPATPVYPTTTSVVVTYQRVDQAFDYIFQYVYQSSRNRCNLQYKAVNRVNTTITETATVPIDGWRDNRTFLGWTYKPVSFNISKLKNSGSNQWRSSVSLPLGNQGATTPISWSGCLEERKTKRITGTPTNADWQTNPASAPDIDINTAPNPTNPDTLWGPALEDAIYLRTKNGNNTIDQFDTNSSDDNSSGYDWKRVTEYCPSQAALYQEWSADDFSGYLNGLQAIGNTYHDVGMLWGARLMSPTGMFSTLTNDRPTDQVMRHMIFMTDGDIVTNNENYSAHGIQWWDRRSNSGSSAPDQSWLNANVAARTQAICTWVRSNNIQLWVVAFGDNINSTSKVALKTCAGLTDTSSASDDDEGDKYFEASNNTQLMTEFKKIANQIGSLRLTQ